MAGRGVAPPSMALARGGRGREGRRWPVSLRPAAVRDGFEAWLDAERDQLGLWLPVVLGLGIGLYFGLGERWMWLAAMALLCGVGTAALAIGRGGRAASVVGWGAVVAMLGVGLAWTRSGEVAAPVLSRPMVVEVRGTVIEADPLPAREQVRLLIAPDADRICRRRCACRSIRTMRRPGCSPARG